MRGIIWGLGALAAYLVVGASVGLAEPPAEAKVDKPTLPAGCDVLYQRTAPGGELVAFVGSYKPGEAEAEHGLFVVELKTGKVRRVLDTPVKTAPAWSPDAKKLAIGNSPGYGNVYPLVIVDVATGQVTKLGIQGVGADWSPDGRYLAFSTEIELGGSWYRGIPVAGRLGVWEFETKKLTLLTPPAYTLQDRATGRWMAGGTFSPVWSPDGRWIAYHRVTFLHQGQRRKDTHQIWVVNGEGTEFRLVSAGAAEVSWSPDSRSVRLTEDGATRSVEINAIKPLTKAELETRYPEPKMTTEEPDPMTKGFDPSPVFERNRPWTNPKLEHLGSVQFVHHMEPKRLDERFVWRQDGTSLIEVGSRENEEVQWGTGARWVTTPEPARYHFPAKTQLAVRQKEGRRQRMDQAFFAGYFRDRLMGTRTSFVALDWGRKPGDFRIQKVRPSDDGQTLRVELIPKADCRINAGAMFYTTSWAYVHDLVVSRSELTIDRKTHRILQEVDFGPDEEICRIKFDDWHDVDQTQSVPQRIEIQIPEHKFTVDYRFQWRPEGLWILTRGESRFSDHEPQREEIRDLKINAPTPALDEALAQIAKSQADLEGRGAIEPEPRPLAVFPFQLGKRIQIPANASPGVGVREVLFRVDRDAKVHGWHKLFAVINMADDTATTDRLVLMLLDAESRPTIAANVLAVPEKPEREKSVLVDLGRSRVLDQTRFWTIRRIRPEAKPAEVTHQAGTEQVKVATYPFRLGEPLEINLPNRPDGGTRLRRVQFERDPQGRLKAKIRVVSQDSGQDLLASVSVVILDEQSTILGAGFLEPRLMVKAAVIDEEFVVDVPGATGEGPRRPSRVFLGLKTYQVGGMIGSKWGSIFITSPLFPLEQLLRADDPPTWRSGLAKLEDKLEEDGLDEDIWDPHGNMHLHRPPPVQTLASYLERIQTLLRESDDAEGLVLLCRLSGRSGEKQLVEDLARRLGDPRPAVQDAAAIGLGLLGDPRGLDRLGPILVRRPAKDAQAETLLQRDAMVALAKIGTPEAVHVLGRAFVQAFEESLTARPNELRTTSSFAPEWLDHDLAAVLRYTPNPIALDYFAQAMAKGKGSNQSEGVDSLIADSLEPFADQEKARTIILDSLHRGNPRFLGYAPKDAAMVRAAGQLAQREGLHDHSYRTVLYYLSRVKSPEALEVLRELHRQNLHPNFADGRIAMASILAAYGDYRALDDAFQILTTKVDPRTLPEDSRKRWNEQHQREYIQDEIVTIFAPSRYGGPKPIPLAETVRFLQPKLASTDRLTLLAALRIVDSLSETPAELKPAITKLTQNPDPEVAKAAKKVMEMP
jgi:Tol biopolymer transport system component